MKQADVTVELGSARSSSACPVMPTHDMLIQRSDVDRIWSHTVNVVQLCAQLELELELL